MKISEIDWNYNDQVSMMENLYILLFYFTARQAVDNFGEKGRKCMADSLTEYGHHRGALLAMEHDRHHYEHNVTSFYKHYDLPRDPRTRQKFIHLDEHTAEEEFYACHFSNIWKMLEDLPLDTCSEIGKIYCDYFHPAMWQGYSAHMNMTLPQIIVKGDSKCSFVTTWDDCPDHTIHCKLTGAEKIDWHYDDGLYVMNTIYALMFFFLINGLLTDFAEEGVKCAVSAIRAYGDYRGRLLSYIHQEQGLPICRDSFFKHYDYPDYICRVDESKNFPAMLSPHSCAIWNMLNHNFGYTAEDISPCSLYHAYMAEAMWEGYIKED